MYIHIQQIFQSVVVALAGSLISLVSFDACRQPYVAYVSIACLVLYMRARVCVCVCECVCIYSCVCVCVCVCVFVCPRASVRACVYLSLKQGYRLTPNPKP